MGARMPFSSAMLAAVQWVLLTGLGAGRRAASTLQVLYRSFQLRLICVAWTVLECSRLMVALSSSCAYICLEEVAK